MIISDEHRFAFVHIPKCAGVSVKRALLPIDSTEGYFRRVSDHPEMGRIHYAHIVLTDLERYFPTEYAKVREYRSVAVLRDPGDRFISAIHQRLREFKKLDQSQITPSLIDAEAAEVIGYLSSRPARLDLEHVHFNRQVDYVVNRDRQIVANIFPLGRMADVAAYIAAVTGLDLEPGRRNQTITVRLSALRPIIRLLRGPYGRLVPFHVRTRVRAGMIRAGIYANAEKRELLPPGGRIDRFVRDYYAADYTLFASAQLRSR